MSPRDGQCIARAGRCFTVIAINPIGVSRLVPRGINAFNPARMRTLRRQRGLSLAELGHRVGWTKWHISRIESGQHHPAVGMLAPLAEALGTTVTGLLMSEPTFGFLRARAGKNQREVAADVGLSAAAVGRIETGVRLTLSPELIDALAGSLGCSAREVRAAFNHARRAP